MSSFPAVVRRSESRAETLLRDLLRSQGWGDRRPPRGQLYVQHEYLDDRNLADALAHASKAGDGPGIPEAILVDQESGEPLAVVETKAAVTAIDIAVDEAESYGSALVQAGYSPAAIGLAGTDEEEFALQVSKWTGRSWAPITYDGNPITWIPGAADLRRVTLVNGPTEIRPSPPPIEVLAARADEINRLLREADIKDEYRPAHVAAVMLSLWYTGGNIRRSPKYVVQDVNAGCQEAFMKAGKPRLGRSLQLDKANDKLSSRVPRIVKILERLNVTVLTAEHDYLGQLYETFFRYTGGNTIGQYFTPRHIARMMVDLCAATSRDTVLDVACGTGGFFVAFMGRLVEEEHLRREETVRVFRDSIVGFESEPATAALCVANMILRGDGSTRIRQADSLADSGFPVGEATVAVTNPPFPHKKTDTPVERFVERSLEGLRDGGRAALIVPSSLLAKGGQKADWRERILSRHSLLGVCQLPDELFQPFASVTTSVILLEKGRPHRAERNAVFVRLQHDGLVLKKGVRAPRENEPNDVSAAIDSIENKVARAGFSAASSVSGKQEWSAGAYIASAPIDHDAICTAVDVQVRLLASFYARYAPEILAQRRGIEAGKIQLSHYRELLTSKRLKNAEKLSAEEGTVGGIFDVYYGMKELHSREGIASGRTLIISPTGSYNGAYGWLDFGTALVPGFVTVAQTGSIGEAFVQLEPCAVNDDCLVLLPKSGASLATLVVAASVLHAEKWRFNYGRKLTPSRVVGFEVPCSRRLKARVDEILSGLVDVVRAAFAPYERRGLADGDDGASNLLKLMRARDGFLEED